jgi:hypothetical protein
MNQYILMLHHEPNAYQSEDMSPQRLQEIVGKYKAWRERMTAAGRIAGGNKLEASTGRVMRADSGGKVHITDGPYIESKEIIGGFFILKAESFEEAAELSRDCPHLEYGTIEVRKIEG